MKHIEDIVNELIKYPSEEDWFEFKENWYEAVGIGEYISSMSNTVAMRGKENAYLIWGVNNETHELTDTTFNYHVDVKNEPLEHFLARQITPDINFEFHERQIDKKRVVVLIIPAANKVPTAFCGNRFIRIGSSKVNLNKYPERESKLFSILKNGIPTLENTESDSQELTFRKLFMYYEDKGIVLNKNTFEKNLGLLTKEGKYNLLASLLSDDSKMSVRVSIFRGTDKATPLYAVREFGNNCLLISLDKVIEYADVLNIMQADETNRVVERKEVPLFNQSAFREAIINSFVHNAWIDGNAPMITVYSDRIEILSRGKLAPNQTMEGFFSGESIPVNQRLSDIFLQLHISERSGRGVPVITHVYGKEAFEFRKNSIVVTIPFEKLLMQAEEKVRNKEGEKVRNKSLTLTRQTILSEMRNNPNITQEQLMHVVGIGKTAIYNNLVFLRNNGYIERIGSKKKGYWKVL
ncbi:MAG: putative DNA binding domain-containing protein [Hespellia sp.]|nr:putative DNA binding domain-containing protein [Hespellia sp.]